MECKHIEAPLPTVAAADARYKRNLAEFEESVRRDERLRCRLDASRLRLHEVAP